MKLPLWFKALYWFVLVVLISCVLYLRLDLIVVGKSTPFDSVVFVIWVALLLAPIFNEVKIWGVELKHELKEAKKEITREIESVKAMVNNHVVVNSHFGIPSPPSDNQLPSIREEVRKAISETLGGTAPQESVQEIEVPSDVNFLFSVRYQLEEQVRRIGFHVFDEPRTTQIRRQVSLLHRYGAITESLATAIIDVYRICSPAIHGDKVSAEQIDFVRDVAPSLIASLQKIPTFQVAQSALF